MSDEQQAGNSLLDQVKGAEKLFLAGRRSREADLESAVKIFLEFLGGELARIPDESAVFDHRQSPYNLLVIGAWEDPTDDEMNRAWARDTWHAMRPFASDRVYVNYLGTEADEGESRVEAAYGPGKFNKLVALKRRYDPTNFFRMNQNIRP